jgi:hypothetical protein
MAPRVPAPAGGGGPEAHDPSGKAASKAPCRVFTLNSLETPPAAAPAGAPVPAGPLSARVPAPGAANDLEATAKKTLARLFEHEREVDRGLRAALSGKSMDAQELLALQAQVIRYSQEVEVASRLVDKLSSGVKQIMQTQV